MNRFDEPIELPDGRKLRRSRKRRLAGERNPKLVLHGPRRTRFDAVLQASRNMFGDNINSID